MYTPTGNHHDPSTQNPSLIIRPSVNTYLSIDIPNFIILTKYLYLYTYYQLNVTGSQSQLYLITYSSSNCIRVNSNSCNLVFFRQLVTHTTWI